MRPVHTPMRRIAAASRHVASLVITLALLATPVAGFSAKGEKNYKRGVEHEAAQRWEQAAEEFALAMAADPANAEYQLHYRRSIFNASQLFMQQGSAHAERGDYVGAYNAFRRAHGYDPSNDLARAMMERMERLQLQKDGGGAPPEKNAAEATITQTTFGHDPAPAASLKRNAVDDATLPLTRAEQLRVITYSGDLEDFIKYLARELKLNVVFDRDFPKRAVETDLQDVTAAQALDYIFLTQGLFFQKLSARTILVADQQKRPQYQQLVLRTFYLYNVDPNEARSLIQAAMPPQAGRQPVITANKTTNSITVRDTPENVRLVSELLKSIDKERAEVVMDVNIYEVSRADLMQFGNQFGSEGALKNLGGIQKGLTIFGGSRDVITSAVAAPTALGAALLVPASTLNALQRKDTTRLIASTQVHAFDGEKSTAHIGQRVPVQTATVAPYGSVSTGEGQPAAATVAPGLFGGNGYPVIQYEKTGLTLEFTPQVSPNLDVQVKMLIKSNDVAQTDGAALTPTFTERNIEGTARIQNNRTMMIASVAQNQQSRGRQGLPVLGLVPVLGRLFTAPRRNDSQTDIVIAVTPHVLRAPAITPHDEETRPSGTLQTPNSDTLEAMLQEVRREEQLAAARAIPRHTVTQLPDADQAAFVPAPKALMNSVAAERDAQVSPTKNAVLTDDVEAKITTTDRAPQTVFVKQQSPSVVEERAAVVDEKVAVVDEKVAVRARLTGVRAPQPLAARAGAYEVSAAELKLSADAQPLRVGERRQVKLLLKTDAPLGLVAATLRFDPARLAVRAVTLGNSLTSGSPSDTTFNHTVTQEGLILFSVAQRNGAPSLTGAGLLLTIEVEALADGDGTLGLEKDDIHVISRDGRRVVLKATPLQMQVGNRQ